MDGLDSTVCRLNGRMAVCCPSAASPFARFPTCSAADVCNEEPNFEQPMLGRCTQCAPCGGPRGTVQLRPGHRGSSRHRRGAGTGAAAAWRLLHLGARRRLLTLSGKDFRVLRNFVVAGGWDPHTAEMIQHGSVFRRVLGRSVACIEDDLGVCLRHILRPRNCGSLCRGRRPSRSALILCFWPLMTFGNRGVQRDTFHRKPQQLSL